MEGALKRAKQLADYDYENEFDFKIRLPENKTSQNHWSLSQADIVFPKKQKNESPQKFIAHDVLSTLTPIDVSTFFNLLKGNGDLQTVMITFKNKIQVMLSIGPFEMYMQPRASGDSLEGRKCFSVEFFDNIAKVHYLNYSDDEGECMVQNGNNWKSLMLKLVDTCAGELECDQSTLSDASYLRDMDISFMRPLVQSNLRNKLEVDNARFQDKSLPPSECQILKQMQMKHYPIGYVSLDNNSFLQNIENSSQTVNIIPFGDVSLALFLISIRGFSYYEARGYFPTSVWLAWANEYDWDDWDCGRKMYLDYHSSIFNWRQSQVAETTLAAVLKMYYCIKFEAVDNLHHYLNGTYKIIYRPGILPETMLFCNKEGAGSFFMIINETECILKSKEHLEDDIFEAKFNIPDMKMNTNVNVDVNLSTGIQTFSLSKQQQYNDDMFNVLNTNHTIRDIVLSLFEQLSNINIDSSISEGFRDADVANQCNLGTVLKAIFHVVEYTICRDIQMDDTNTGNETWMQKRYTDKNTYRIVQDAGKITIIEEQVPQIFDFIESIQLFDADGYAKQEEEVIRLKNKLGQLKRTLFRVSDFDHRIQLNAKIAEIEKKLKENMRMQ